MQNKNICQNSNNHSNINTIQKGDNLCPKEIKLSQLISQANQLKLSSIKLPSESKISSSIRNQTKKLETSTFQPKKSNLKNSNTFIRDSTPKQQIQKEEINISFHTKSPPVKLSGEFPFNKPMTPSNGNNLFLLPNQSIKNQNKKTLFIDIDETIIHSQFLSGELFGIVSSVNDKTISHEMITKDKADLFVKINYFNSIFDIYVNKRPYLSYFLQKMSQLFELVAFTASLDIYAAPILDKIDDQNYFSFRLFRNHCKINGMGHYIKCIDNVGRNPKNCIILDNNPLSYSLNRENGLPIKTWMNDKKDKELLKIAQVLEFLSKVDDVRDYIKLFVENENINFDNFFKTVKETHFEDDVNNDLNDENNCNNNFNNTYKSYVRVQPISHFKSFYSTKSSILHDFKNGKPINNQNPKALNQPNNIYNQKDENTIRNENLLNRFRISNNNQYSNTKNMYDTCTYQGNQRGMLKIKDNKNEPFIIEPYNIRNSMDLTEETKKEITDEKPKKMVINTYQANNSEDEEKERVNNSSKEERNLRNKSGSKYNNTLNGKNSSLSIKNLNKNLLLQKFNTSNLLAFGQSVLKNPNNSIFKRSMSTIKRDLNYNYELLKMDK